MSKHTTKDLVIALSTYGGSKDQGMAILATLQLLAKTRTVWLVCQSYVHLMGIYVMLALPKSQRVALPYCSFYCHLGRLEHKVEIKGYLDAHLYAIKEYQATIDDFRKYNEELVALLVQGTNVTPEQARRLLKEPRYIYPDEAIKLGFIDHVME